MGRGYYPADKLIYMHDIRVHRLDLVLELIERDLDPNCQARLDKLLELDHENVLGAFHPYNCVDAYAKQRVAGRLNFILGC